MRWVFTGLVWVFCAGYWFGGKDMDHLLLGGIFLILVYLEGIREAL